MTKDEIMNMEAGVEMDKVVAEQVMGWHIATKDNDWKFWADKDGKFAHGINQSDNDWSEDDEDYHILHFHPSGSFLAMEDVIEKLSEKFKVTIEFFKNGGVNVTLSRVDHQNILAGDNTAPPAVCRVALLAVLEGK